MTILNYTGEPVGLLNHYGLPVRVLPSKGRAQVVGAEEIVLKVEDSITIYAKRVGHVRYLPAATGNQDPMYIVSKEIAEASQGRIDLLTVEDMVMMHGAKFYRKLIYV